MRSKHPRMVKFAKELARAPATGMQRQLIPMLPPIIGTSIAARTLLDVNRIHLLHQRQHWMEDDQIFAYLAAIAEVQRGQPNGRRIVIVDPMYMTPVYFFTFF